MSHPSVSRYLPYSYAWGPTVSLSVVGVTPCKYVDEPYNIIFPETRYIELPASEGGIILRSFVWTQYRRVTDGRTDRNTVANTARSIAAH